MAENSAQQAANLQPVPQPPESSMPTPYPHQQPLQIPQQQSTWAQNYQNQNAKAEATKKKNRLPYIVAGLAIIVVVAVGAILLINNTGGSKNASDPQTADNDSIPPANNRASQSPAPGDATDEISAPSPSQRAELINEATDEDEIEATIVAMDPGTYETANASVQYEKGTSTESGYESVYFGLTFTAPEGAIMRPGTGLSEAMEMEVTASDGLTNMNLVVAEIPENMSEEMIIEMAKAAMKLQIDEETMSMSFDDVTPGFLIAGQKFILIPCTIELYGMQLHQDMFLGRYENRILQITVTYASFSIDQKEALINGFSAIGSGTGIGEHQNVAPSPPVEAQTGNTQYERGVLTEHSYESEFFNLKFTAPTGVDMLSEMFLFDGDEMTAIDMSSMVILVVSMMGPDPVYRNITARQLAGCNTSNWQE